MLVWCDGSARNNQNAAERVSACRIVTEDGYEQTWSLGAVSNNLAELHGILEALRYAHKQGSRKVTVLSDSRCALSWVDRGPSSSLKEETRNAVNKLLEEINDLISTFKSVLLQQCKGEDQRADFGHKRRSRTK